MPSFGRLGKHGSRSQQGLVEQQQQQKLSSSVVAGADSALAPGTTAPGSASANLHEPAGRGHGAPVTGGVPGQVPGGNAKGSGLNLKTILGAGAGKTSHPVSASADSPLLHHQAPFPGPSGLSSREEIEVAQRQLRQFQGQGPPAAGPNRLQKQPRQAQLQQQQLSHPPPPQHLFDTAAPSQPAQPASSTAPPINTNIPPPAANPASLPPQQHHHQKEAAFVGQQQLQLNALQRNQGNLDDFDARQVLPTADYDTADGEALADTSVSPSQRFGPAPLTTASSSTSPSASTPHNLAHLQTLPSPAASSSITPGQQGIYGVGVATTSVDELSSPSLAYSPHQPIPLHQQLHPQQQPPPQQQGKKSSRKLPIINRFFGSGRSSSQGHHPPPDKQSAQDASFDNAGAGLFSKSASTKRSSRIATSQTVRQVSDTDSTNTARSGDVHKQDPRLPFTATAASQADNRSLESWHKKSPLREPRPDQLDIGDEASSPIRDPYISNNNSQQDLLRRQPESRAGLHPTDIPNLETSSQLSNESPVTDDSRGDYQAARDTNNQFYDSLQQQPQAMAPAGASTTNRRDAETALRGVKVEPPAGPPPGYRVGAAGANPASLVPGQGAAIGQANSFKGERAAQFEGAPVEQGRDSPQPNAENETESPKFKELLTKYKHVKRLYFDGKHQIEDLNTQVERLQNAVANQRMSQSRTALDDSEYVTRFTRLDGAIKDLSFNIRKDWRCLPKWLDSYVSADALKTAKQEMTAVGRAVISRWLVEEIFNKCFHPGLEIPLSMHLKDIELSIRGNAHTMHSREEFDALTTKIVNWRMATLDGLQKKLDVTTTATNRALFVKQATANLTACLHQYLTSPPPGGIEGSATTIVEIAAGVVANLPLESRDVSIMYPLPGEAVRPGLMDVDKNALPTLDGSQRPESDTEEDDDEERNKALAKDSKVRFAGFMAVEVRGRQVLMKAPVWIL